MTWWTRFNNWLEEWLQAIVNGDQTSVIINHMDTQNTPLNAPQAPVAPSVANPDILVPWGTQKSNYHNSRVLCDLSGLTLNEKNIICACIYVESAFFNYLSNGNPIKHENLNKDGSLSSTDWGIVQINDWFHIAPHGSPFPSVVYVMENPQSCVQFMIDMYKEGQLTQWDSFLHGAYRQYLVPNSPMFALAS